MTVEVMDTTLTHLLSQVQRVDELVPTHNGKPVARLLPMETPKPVTAEPVSPPLRNVPDFQVSQGGDAIEQEIAAFERQHPVLLQHYLQQYVAIYQGRVIDHDSNQLSLLARIDRQYPVNPVLIRKVEPTLPKPWRVRSPRLRKAV